MPPLPYSGDYSSAHLEDSNVRASSKTRHREMLPHAPGIGTSGRAPRQQDVFYIGGYVLNKGRIQEVLVGRKGRRGVKYVGSIPARAIQQPTKALLQTLRLLGVYGCEFTNLPEESSTVALPLSPSHANAHALTEERMHDCLWVEPSLKALVSFDGWTASGHLLHPQILTVL